MLTRPAHPRARAGLLLLATLLSLGAWTTPASAAEPVAPVEPPSAPAPSDAPVVVAPAEAAPVPVTSPVAAVVQPDGPRWEVMGARATATLRSLGVDAATYGYRVDFAPGRGGLRGITYPDQRLIVVYVRDSHDDYDVLRTLAHEIGHAVSETCLDGGERRAYQRERGLGTSWYPSTLSAFSGTEDHAEVFAYATLGGTRDFRGYSAAAPGADLLASLRAQHLLGC
ncbi:hypothetical protein GCM10028777_14120 [Angustibacter speluncae]